MSLEMLELSIGTLGALWLHGHQLQPRSLPNGDFVYEFVFPDSLDGVLRLQRRS
jgi:hypothetical protein